MPRVTVWSLSAFFAIKQTQLGAVGRRSALPYCNSILTGGTVSWSHNKLYKKSLKPHGLSDFFLGEFLQPTSLHWPVIAIYGVLFC